MMFKTGLKPRMLALTTRDLPKTLQGRAPETRRADQTIGPNILARPAGFEPTTPWFVAKYSIQLSYGR